MRDEEFKQRLTEVAEWHTPLDLDYESKQHNKVKMLKRLESQGETVNDTFPPRITAIKHKDSACEDCGKIVQGRRVEIQIYRNNNTCGRKEKCVTCGLHKDPYTGQFCLTGTEASIKWNSYARGLGRRYRPKVANDQEKITFDHQYQSER